MGAKPWATAPTQDPVNATSNSGRRPYLSLSGPIANVETNCAPAYAETKELLEDYYERLLQIRDMSHATLQQQMADEEARHHAAETALASGKQLFAGLAAVLAVLLAVVAETAHAGAVSGPLVSTTLLLYNSTPALMIATGFIVHVLTRLTSS